MPDATAIEAYFERSRAEAWFSNTGPCHRLLVQRFEALLGRGIRCVPVASGTSGLMLALRAVTAHASPKAREVLIPSFSFAAVPAAVLWSGFVPVFVDVLEASWHPCPERIRTALKARRGRVAAVVACSTFGTPPDSSIAAAWREAAAAHDVGLVVDSAAGFGASNERGEMLGAQGDAEVFSFHATKSFAIGEGGLVTSTNPEIAERIARLANFGFSAERTIDGAMGLNAKMSEWHAATALAVLDGYDAVVARRRSAGARMEQGLASSGYRFQPGRQGSVWQFVPALAPTPDARQASLERATAAHIEMRTYFDPALHRMSAFSGVEVAGTLDITERLAKACISLPMANDLSESETERICAAVAGG